MRSLFLPVCGLAVCVGSLAFAQQNTTQPSAAPALTTPPPDPAPALEPELRRFLDVLTTVETQAADPQTADKMIYEGAIPSMLRQLDPHTQFFEPSQFEQLKQMEQSEQKGFGSIVSVLPGQVIFLQIFPGTPSSKAGIQPGDELVAIGQVVISQLEPDRIVELLTQARQQQITVMIRRQGDAQLLPFTLTPALVDSPTVDRAFLLQPGFGYVRVTSWDMQTAEQLRTAIKKINTPELKGLVLDLRDNPGGIVQAALAAASMFLQPGQRILTAKGRAGVVESADVPKNAKPYGFRLAVLVNGKTASASEIVSGALQDHDRATIAGTQSYGKGLVQSVMPLSEGAGMALTTAFYYTPSGRSIQKPLQNSALSRTFNGAAPVFKTDAGRSVTGGGGIHPDIVVEPQEHTQFEAVVDASGALTAFATNYLTRHSPLPENFQLAPSVLDDLKVFLSERRIQPNVTEWSQERPWIANRLLEEIVTQAHGVAAGDEIGARRDPQIQAALHALQK
jgi:carboxyl-terminal processing protease